MSFNTAGKFIMGFLCFLGHVIISAIGVAVIASVVRYALVLFVQGFNPSLSRHFAKWMQWILFDTPYFPAQIVIGLIWGFGLGRRLNHKAMLWTWIVPAFTIIILLLVAPFPETVVDGVVLTRFEHFFGSRCLPQNHCFEQVGLTLPLYASAAYSFGALVARRISHFTGINDTCRAALFCKSLNREDSSHV